MAQEKLFGETTIGSFLSEGEKVITVLTTDTVETVLQTLSKHYIHGAPVMKPDYSCVGMVDWLDLVAYLVEVSTEMIGDETSAVSSHLTTDDMDQLMERAAKFSLSTVEESKLANRASTDPLVILPESASLTEAVELFGKGVHRICISSADDKNSIIGVLTQSMINSWIAEDVSRRLGAIADETPESLGLIKPKKMITTTVDVPAIDAFIKMKKNFVGSLVVVDEEGNCRGVISATDLKYIKGFNFKLLLLPTIEFLKNVRNEQDRPTKVFKATVSPSTKISNILIKLSTERVHRVVVVDENDKPLGTVSLSNISNALDKYLHPRHE